MIKVPRMMSNARCKEVFAGEDLGEACANCRFYDESRGTTLAVCKVFKIKTVVAAYCNHYEKKEEDAHEG